MKITLIALSMALGAGLSVSGQTTTNRAPEKGAARSVFAGSGENRSVFSKPDIKELMQKGQFTNATGMVMTKISDALWAGVYLVTQEDYTKVMGGNPSRFRNDRNPVDSVSWNDAMSFCARLADAETKEKMMPEGFTYTLPTQAQWENLAGGTSLANAVTSQTSNRGGAARVGTFPPNGLGLYDARGNLWQWCLDPADKPYRVLRGGAWNEWIEINLRFDFRWYSNGPEDRQNFYGFRVVLIRNRN